jgi:hypothetical protein
VNYKYGSREKLKRESRKIKAVKGIKEKRKLTKSREREI